MKLPAGIKLKGCPLCKGKALLFKYLEDKKDPESPMNFMIICEDCSIKLIRTDIFRTSENEKAKLEEVIFAWNKRINE